MIGRHPTFEKIDKECKTLDQGCFLMFLNDFNLIAKKGVKSAKCVSRKEALDIFHNNSHLRRYMNLGNFKTSLKSLSLKIYDSSKESELGIPLSILKSS